MTLSLEQLSARMRQGEDVPLSDTARIALALSIPSILEQLVVTAMSVSRQSQKINRPV